MPKYSRQPQSRRSWIVLAGLVLFLYLPQPPLNLHERLYRERHTRSFVDYPQQYVVSACVLVRDASTILPEFFVRNYLAGVDHFFIYGDDDAEDELQRITTVLEGFKRIVTYLPGGRLLPEDAEDSKNYVQMRVYRHCAATFGDLTRWMTFIDADEFFETDQLSVIQSQNKLRGRHAFLHDVLEAHDHHPVLCVRWRSVFTNGRVMPPSREVPLFDAYPVPCAMRVNNTMKLSLRKTILKPALLDLNATPSLDVALHKGFRLKPPMHRFHCIWGPGSKISPPIYFAHYWSRSLYDYVQKIGRGRPREGVPSRTLTDLIDREQVCIPDLASSIDPARRETVRRYSAIFKTVNLPSLSNATQEQILLNLQNSADSTLCSERIATLLQRIANGFTLSSRLYCKQVGPTPACARTGPSGTHIPTQFVWIEYIRYCDIELNNDHIFIRSDKQ